MGILVEDDDHQDDGILLRAHDGRIAFLRESSDAPPREAALLPERRFGAECPSSQGSRDGVGLRHAVSFCIPRRSGRRNGSDASTTVTLISLTISHTTADLTEAAQHFLAKLIDKLRDGSVSGARPAGRK
jgi:hypothetical protein